MSIKYLVGSALALSLSVLSASAATVAASGTGSSGAGGFTLTGGSGVIVDIRPHPAYINSPTSQTSNWVWDSANTTRAPLSFSYDFDLTGFDVTTAALVGEWAVDNIGTATLNGTALSTLSFTVASFNQYNPFSAGAGLFNAGLNTLSFNVQDLGLPGGLRAAFEVTADVSAVPLPASLPLLAVAFGGLGLAARRRKAA